MNSPNFYNQLNQVASILQIKAFDLTSDMDKARALYLETVYLAEKNSSNFRQGINFKDWILQIMRTIKNAN